MFEERTCGAMGMNNCSIAQAEHLRTDIESQVREPFFDKLPKPRNEQDVACRKRSEEQLKACGEFS